MELFFPNIQVIFYSWDLKRHIKAHNGEQIICEYCGNSYSKKSNLFNHLHRGKGCPKRGESPDSPTQNKKETERNKVKRREEKIKIVQVKQETDEESDTEPRNLVIDNRDQSIMVTHGVKTETMEDPDGEPQVQMEDSNAGMRDPPVNSLQSSQDRFDFLKSQRDLLSHSTPSPPPRPSAPMDLNLLLLADAAVEIKNAAPLNLTTTARTSIIMASPPLTTHRDIRPVSRVTSGQPLKPAAGQPYNPAQPPIMVIQSNGELVPQTNGGPGHVVQPHTPQFSRIRLPAAQGGVILHRTNIGWVRWFNLIR